ncbi:carboxymuconolactone decarboxylase family protein [Catenulispora subtropica]|uniref:Carboxymuconolactone decarboxylase family protein n=1 Tax=Catenulispora subtropica TaxID=450798 RepID=A0ABN2T2E2_9ACTN
MDVNLWRRALRSTALAQIRYIRPVAPGAARHLVAQVYADVERDFGVLAPPVALHSPAPELMAAVWLVLRESAVADGRAARATKEALAAAVSGANTCPYCVTVHGAALDSLIRSRGRGKDSAAIADGEFERIGDPGIRATAEWGRAAAVRETADHRTGHHAQPPFPPEQVPELLGVALVFHYLNRVVNVFLPEVPMPDRAPRGMLRLVAHVLGGRIRSAADRSHPAGVSLSLLPDAPLPADLAWAGDNPTVAGALARAAATIDKAGEAAVPESVRTLVHARLRDWDGRPPGLDRSWLHKAVEVLPAADRPAGRLALLVALASWQIDAAVVEDYRVAAPADKTLVELTAWAALTAARAVVAWSPAAWTPTVPES